MQPSDKPSLNSNFLFLLLLLFGGSGCAALIYEIVWYQLLQLAIGSTAVSLGMLLATFMGGFCIGSIALPRLRLPVSSVADLCGTRSGHRSLWRPDGLRHSAARPRLYRRRRPWVTRHAAARPDVRALYAPADHPDGRVAAGYRELDQGDADGVAWWGLLYGANTAGAVFGCLFAGFYLLRLYDIMVATFVAAVINIAVAAVSYLAAARTPGETTASPSRLTKSSGNRVVYVAIATLRRVRAGRGSGMDPTDGDAAAAPRFTSSRSFSRCSCRPRHRQRGCVLAAAERSRPRSPSAGASFF